MTARTKAASDQLDLATEQARSRAQPPTVQRLIATIRTDKSDQIVCTLDDERPPGNIKEHDGDHSTPFISLQHEIVNAISGADLVEAWDNLAATYKVYQSLPGWSLSKPTVQKGISELKGFLYDVPAMLAGKGDLQALLNTGNAMLALRNQIGLSAMQGKKQKGTGKAEATYSGGLHHLEAEVRRGKDASAQKDEVVFSMCMLFDHGRNEGRTPALADATWNQHCQTMISAYPMLAIACKISHADLYPLREEYRKEWDTKYGTKSA
jgi:hypothetical protein